RINIPLFTIGIIVAAGTIGYCAYGIWNAYHPIVQHISVSIKGLPSEWKGKKIVHVSDVHLGFIWGEKFFEKLVADINAQKPEAVFITGDLFDGTGDKFDYVKNDLLKLSPPRGTYFVTGNHETYFGVEKSYELLENSGVTVLKDEMKIVDGLEIIGVSYGERRENKPVADTIKKIKGYDPEAPSILLFHEPMQIKEIKQTGINLQLSGHTHAGQIFPYGFITSLVYPGVDYGLHSFGDYSIYTTSGAGTWGPTMRVGTKSEIVVITLK
ncbi:MAG: metallophosphoesterase, partial [Candidatus Pacebacteria bacterium]|nr:metallophosphoesterase [Candidatus Paceibacterota bacterium]